MYSKRRVLYLKWRILQCGINDESVYLLYSGEYANEKKPQFTPDFGSKLYVHVPRSRYGGKGEKLGNCKKGKEYIVEEAAYYNEALKLRLQGWQPFQQNEKKK